MTVKAMLAAKFDEKIVAKHLAEDGYLHMQPKIDGMRVLNIDALPISRSGKEFKHKPLRALFRDRPSLRGCDGEVVAGHVYSADSFRDSMSGVRAEDGNPEFTYYIFDHIDEGHQVYNHRLGFIRGLLEGRDEMIIASDAYNARLVKCPSILVTTMDQINEMEAVFIADGWEGAILRRNSRRYKHGRATALEGALTKMKRFEDAEAIVVGFEPWYVNGNEAERSPLGYTARSAHQENLVAIDRLGALNVELLTDRSVKFSIGVFLGLTHGDRDRLWADRDALIGRICKFKHQGYGGGYDAPRTPVWLGWRSAFDL